MGHVHRAIAQKAIRFIGKAETRNVEGSRNGRSLAHETLSFSFFLSDVFRSHVSSLPGKEGDLKLYSTYYSTMINLCPPLSMVMHGEDGGNCNSHAFHLLKHYISFSGWTSSRIHPLPFHSLCYSLHCFLSYTMFNVLTIEREVIIDPFSHLFHPSTGLRCASTSFLS